jgi:predicted TIM-barrel fold metal-dependent hydrolase
MEQSVPQIDQSALRGRMVDLDSHLMIFPNRLVEMFGPGVLPNNGRPMARRATPEQCARFLEVIRRTQGITPTPDNVFTLKGFPYGCNVAAQRLEVINAMGVERQLVFPSGLWGAQFANTPEAYATVRRYNDYILEWARESGGRLRPAAIINLNSIDEAMKELERVARAGAYAAQFACNAPPANLSPADPQWEPFWSMLEASNLPGLFHIAGNFGFVNPRFGALPILLPKGPLEEGTEPVGPYFMQIMHYAPEAYLSAMIFGGVFERHPRLRWGVIELGARWVGPWLEMMDATAERFHRRFDGVLSLKPSDYVRRQIRVTPFDGEPAGEFIAKYGLEDVLVFSTDFPHFEGGTDPVGGFLKTVAPLGARVVEKFFVENGKLLLP